MERRRCQTAHLIRFPLVSSREYKRRVSPEAMTTLTGKSVPRIAALAAALALPLVLASCATREEPPTQSGYSKNSPPEREVDRLPAPCTPEWTAKVEQKLHITDASGHGPDVGSQEWMHAVGRRSGVTDSSGHGPDPGSDEWCRAVDYKVFGRR